MEIQINIITTLQTDSKGTKNLTLQLGALMQIRNIRQKEYI